MALIFSANSMKYYAIDYMLETMFLGCYLLFIFVRSSCVNYLLTKIDANRSLLHIGSENNNKPDIIYTSIQSAENCKGFSETIRQLSNKKNKAFFQWLAGIIDGDGNFDMRNLNSILTLKTIRIKLHNRDIRILTRIQDTLHVGKIWTDKKKPYSRYNVSTKKDMEFLVNKLNGLIRIKVDGFKKACDYLGITYIEANYIIEPYDPYFAGLVDTDGTIIYNYNANRIECNLEFKCNDHTKKLNFDNVIPYYKPSKSFRIKKNTGRTKQYYSIAFKYQTVNGMLFLYDYFTKNRLYSDFKYYRVLKIKQFINIRQFQKYPKGSPEFQVYSNFIIKWIQYQNPLWYKVPFVDKIR